MTGTIRAFASAAAVAVLAAGYAVQGASQGAPAKHHAPSIPGAAQSCGNNPPCVIRVLDSAAACAPEPRCADHERTDLRKDELDIEIVWQLVGGHDQFCKGDGVFLIEASDGQFDRMYRIDASGNAYDGDGCTKRFHWRARNSQNPGKQYRYRIVFRDGSQAHDVDPIIVNN